ncbi:MAG: hypothetical protein LBJ13_02910 [Puniceicoccales bacterium]|jgi:hypothetical protein|nr:hypothetical protein [Puniceicoccales bacterium]
MKRRSKRKYCCEELKDQIEEGAGFTKNKLIVYDAPHRSYGIIDEEDDPGLLCKAYVPMSYCPFCGTEFPPDLAEKWAQVIVEELGPEYLIEFEIHYLKLTTKNYVPDPDLPEAKPLPEEFKTDEWWKKRGL